MFSSEEVEHEWEYIGRIGTYKEYIYFIHVPCHTSHIIQYFKIKEENAKCGLCKKAIPDELFKMFKFVYNLEKLNV